jgi:hypothetical protein
VRTPGKKTAPLLLLALIALIALVVAGCGGGGDETETTTPTVEEPTALTQDELIEQGDGVCAEVNAAVGALSSSETESQSEQSEKVANLYLGMVERLQDLGAPEESDSDYVKFSEATEQLAKAEGELKAAAEEEDVAGLEEAGQEASAALAEFQSQAAIYGFEDCSDEPGTLPTPAGSGEAAPSGEEFEGEEGGVEPEYVEPAPEEEIVPEEEVAPETGGAGGGSEAPEPAPETGGESGGVGPG